MALKKNSPAPHFVVAISFFNYPGLRKLALGSEDMNSRKLNDPKVSKKHQVRFNRLFCQKNGMVQMKVTLLDGQDHLNEEDFRHGSNEGHTL
ncbi:MAG: hypothetical protein WCF65_06530, partial [Parachlamydiaceae bacterium]